MIRPNDTLRMQLWDRFLKTRRRRLRNELAEAYLPIVRTVAELIAARVPRYVDPEDLISVGVFGLLQAIEAFDPRRKVKFETFCRPRVRGAMIDELRSSDHLSRHARDRARMVFGVRSRLRQELSREPNHHELSQRMKLAPRDIERALLGAATRPVLSLDHATGGVADDEEPLALADDLVDGRIAPFDEAHRNDLLHLIGGNLSVTERVLIRMRYGDELPMRVIGRALGVTESRISQLHSRLLLRLHRKLAAET